ncbi:MAG: GTPase Era [Actinobacteria bacterium]|nr:GTPase Era [Actinomycetota bacterium]MCB9388469.1 GTPase Era [Acidimicrobiia bacterium]
MASEDEFRSGFVAVLGRPNVGKSTLVNAVCGQKVAITSDKPQTTRNQIRGIVTTDDFQLVLIDTPGIHKPHTALGTRLNQTSSEATSGVEVVWHVVDGARGIGKGDLFVAERLPRGAKRFLVVNKADRMPQARMMAQLAAAESDLPPYDEYVPISARRGEGIGTLVDLTVSELAPGPAYYPDEEVTDQEGAFMVAELVREQLLARTRDELPHSIAVVTDEFFERDDGMLHALVTIYVERESQKGIVIGKDGSVLRDAGTAARLEIEDIFDARVFLKTRVRLERSWPRRQALIDRMGY